jgi:F-box interacting protein
MDCSKNEGAVAALPDDPLVEILSRVPAKSVCRFKCVSKAWRDLIANPHHRKKLPQAMQGLFFMVPEDLIRVSFSFIDLTTRSVPLDIDPAFSFLSELPEFHNLGLKDSCNGLILFKNYEEPPYSDTLGYVVCNPTTKRWQAVPTCGSLDLTSCAYLAFDQAISSHFHLVQFQLSVPDEMLVSLHVYSSETGTWSRNQIDSQENQGPLAEWHLRAMLSRRDPECAFVNGFLHFIVGDSDQHQIVAVDVQGKARRVITVPGVADGRHRYCYLGQSQGCLHCMTQEMFDDHEDRYKLSIWVLQDYDTQWVLKDTVSSMEIFGQLTSNILHFIVGIHRDRNVVFFQSLRSNLIAYDMDHKEVSVIATFEVLKKPLRFAHYVPCFSESPALTN